MSQETNVRTGAFSFPKFPLPSPIPSSWKRRERLAESYEPKPISELYTGWQEMLAEHRQIVVEVQEIAEETGWRGENA